MKRSSKNAKGVVLTILMGWAGIGGSWGAELLSGPYTFDSSVAVHVKPAMLGDGWGLTLGGAFETVINKTVTAGAEVNADIPVVPYPSKTSETISMISGGLRLGALFNSQDVLHPTFNNTVGVGLVSEQTFLFDEVQLGGELNVTKGLRVIAGVGYRYTYGINWVQGLSDQTTRGLFFDVGLRYGELGR